jgi:colicin import membrane protein
MSDSDAVSSAGTPENPGPELAVRDVVPAPRRPNLRGDLDSVLDFLPCFRGALRGYERSQVDSYVSWAERELRAARRSADEMAARFGACSVELHQARQELARSDAGRDVRQVSERVGQIFELAAEEAAEIVAAGSAEAEGLVADARAYSAAMLAHAREVTEASAALAEQAARTRAAAVDALQAAEVDAEDLRVAAAAERGRLTAEAAEERARLDRESAASRAEAEEKARRQREQEAAAAAEAVAAARRELQELQCQRKRADASLRQLTERIGDALQALAAGLPIELPNVVAVQPQERSSAGSRPASS